MMESKVYIWKYFHHNWLNLFAIYVSPQQSDSSKLILFLALF